MEHDRGVPGERAQLAGGGVRGEPGAARRARRHHLPRTQQAAPDGGADQRRGERRAPQQLAPLRLRRVSCSCRSCPCRRTSLTGLTVRATAIFEVLVTKCLRNSSPFLTCVHFRETWASISPACTQNVCHLLGYFGVSVFSTRCTNMSSMERCVRCHCVAVLSQHFICL